MSRMDLYDLAFPRGVLVPRNRGDGAERFPEGRPVGRMLSKKLSARAAGPGLRKPALVSTCMGAIESLLLTIPSYVFDGEDARAYQDVYSGVLATLPAGIDLVVVLHEGYRAAAEPLFAGPGHLPRTTFIEAPIHVNFSVWAEDGYIGATDGVTGSPYLLEPLQFTRYGDSLIADWVEDHTDERSLQVPLIFQGGNCLVGDDFWLMGMDYAVDTLRIAVDQYRALDIRYDTPEDGVKKVVAAFGQYVDASRKMHLVSSQTKIPPQDEFAVAKEGGTFYVDFPYQGTSATQPIFHIDMFLSLMGRNTDGAFEIAVGSPALAAEVLGAPEYRYGLQDAFDDIAAELTALGFAVHRTPMPMAYTKAAPIPLATIQSQAPDIAARLRQIGAGPRDSAVVRTWYFATANNCLVQVSAAGKTVWLPTYGHGSFGHLAAVDQAVKAFWEAAGFEARMLPDFHVFAAGLGAVHCIKKYLRRGR